MEVTLENKINFWVNGIGTIGVAITGVILNSICIHIIRKTYETANIFYRMLVSLLCFDIFVLVMGTNLSLYVAFRMNNIVVLYMFPYFMIPFMKIAITASTFMTVAIAHERYLAVRSPLKYSQHMMVPKRQSKRLKLYLSTVIITSLAFNAPHFMELEVRYIDPTLLVEKDVCHTNESSHLVLNKTANVTNQSKDDIQGYWGSSREKDSRNRSAPIICYTSLGENPYYLNYYRNWTKLMVTGVIPFVLLIFFNNYIYKAIKKKTRMLEEIDSSKLMTYSTKPKDDENLWMALIGIVTIFLVCHSLRIGLNLYDGISGKVGATSATRVLGYFSNFLILLNSAINMIVYCIINTAFRNRFKNIIKNVLPCAN